MADDHKEKLKDFIALIPQSKAMIQRQGLGPDADEIWGEVASGSPAFAKGTYTKEQVQAIVDQKFPVVENDKFKTLTGLTHKALLANWVNGGILTSCNGFVGKACTAMGSKTYLGGFDVQLIMKKLNKSHAWILPSANDKPGYGDLFETRYKDPKEDFFRMHVGISLGFDGDKWLTVEGGQGGPGTGHDKVARKVKKYRTERLLGWVDMRLYLSDQPPIPDWLIGNWMIYYGDNRCLYRFNRYGDVEYSPAAPVGGSANTAAIMDAGTVQLMTGDSFAINWRAENGREIFTYDRWNSFPGINEKMTGATSDGTAMKGIKL